ncbi:ParB/RepB/Spo0J family partition protein [Candidatus Gottesmanbacteria bacterium]|nr:ParB/RepB/Spo0J family partition protein [Candidatus Gottesmanbacteria bacterium]
MSTSSYPYRELIDLDINLLQPNPLQVRSLIKSESLVDLVESIKEHGVLEPLVVAKTPAGYQIIAGERRWRASKIVGLKTVPVIVRETDARGMLEMALVENVQREQLNPIERAQGFQRLIDEFGLGATEIAKRIGKSPAYISNTLRLLSLPDAIKDGLISTEITEGHARAIAGLGDVKLMVDAYKTILTEGASVRRAEDLARRIREAKAMPPRGKAGERLQSVELEALAVELSKSLKAHVKIFQSTISAKVQIVFKGDPESTNVEIKNITEKLKNISN